MIFYFSATGNSKYVSERIASEICETAWSIERSKTKITIGDNEILGFVTPAYAAELPIIMRKFMEKLIISGKPLYTFVAVTYGSSPGASGGDAAHILRSKGIATDARYSIRMPDTWTPIFDLSDPEKVTAKNEYAEIEINKVIQNIKDRKIGNMMSLSVPYPVRFISDIWYTSMRRTKNLSVEDSCIGCGLCEKQCPAKAIRITDGKPEWVKEKCVMCLRCLHHCPKFAIQYRKNTKKYGQYTNPYVKV